ncbi:GNAT family N-acetyltransferase [Bradyrhizobium sp. CCBAU 21360]|uniref:GNAT family N-acetyltransferase n=1 Tax=Bradyrhizobium sp. CCBAU 21360 TaxID=1325081 RepID=UPI002305EFD6|nr:GNAT family N-acetyltransferase [Bradyrhizobium sp. CCBAU 21360]MDA9445747.1 hypothetical protein [Bradyrhizobium sp. CCBAU 21360]
MVTHQTEHLIFTTPRSEHQMELFKLHNDPLVQEMAFNNVPQSIEDVRKWLDMFSGQWRKNGFGDWMVYEKTNSGPIFIGRCGLRDYEDSNNLELATSLCERGRGQGLGLEAALFATTQALQSSTKEKVVAVIKHGNARSERVVKKLGLRYVEDRWRYGRVWQYYETTREEYFSQSPNKLMK